MSVVGISLKIRIHFPLKLSPLLTELSIVVKTFIPEKPLERFVTPEKYY